MNIFCDTNIIMEYLQHRRFAEQVKQILQYAAKNHENLFISFGSFYTITYLTERYLKTDETLNKEARISLLRYILRGVMGTFMFADQHDASINNGVNDSLFDDLEDSYQAHVAEDTGCDILLTINKRHFTRFESNYPVKVMTPIEFVESFL